MSQIDPLGEFAAKLVKKTIQEPAKTTERKSNGLDAIRRFFEDDAISDIYSKENLGSESYVQPGHPCHGGYDDSDSKNKP